MELQHVNVKIFVAGALSVDLEHLIKVFHRWTAEQSLDELLIDVADYQHVPAGPGIVLIGHEADYALDNADNRWGLLYNRKAALDGSNQDRFAQAFRSAANACLLLEKEFNGELQFSRQEFQLLINDRALAPNTVETFETCRPEFENFLKSQLGCEQFTLKHDADPRRRFRVTITAAAPLDFAARP